MVGVPRRSIAAAADQRVNGGDGHTIVRPLYAELPQHRAPLPSQAGKRPIRQYGVGGEILRPASASEGCRAGRTRSAVHERGATSGRFGRLRDEERDQA